MANPLVEVTVQPGQNVQGGELDVDQVIHCYELKQGTQAIIASRPST